MMSERDSIIKVTSLAQIREYVQVTTAVSEGSSNGWSAVRNNSTNFWYVNLGNGIVSNNNGYNRNRVVPCPLPSAELLSSLLLEAEERCYANKHSSIEATRVHYHLAEIYYLASYVYEYGLTAGQSQCSVLDYPVCREMFCAMYYDRLFHHLTEPLMSQVAEGVHEHNGDISFGNRKGHSAYTAAVRIQQELRRITDGWTKKAWVSTRDYSGFFMSINRQMAADMFKYYAGEGDELHNYLVEIVQMYILSDPTENCIRKSPLSAWNKVPDNKTLFKARKGYGVPLGNLPSQIIANLVRAVIDYRIQQENPQISQTIFVDDREMASDNLDVLKKAVKDAESISAQYELKTNPRKRYMQPADHGVKFCGYVIKCDRLYISNRVVSAAFYLVDYYEDKTDIESEEALMRSLNSYMGMMCHCNAYNIQKRLMKKVLSTHKTLYFAHKPNHLICKQKRRFKPMYRSVALLRQYVNGNKSLRGRANNRRPLRHIDRNV